MQNFDTFFKVHFNNRSISDDEIRAYCAEHLVLMASDSRFTDLYVATRDLYEAYFGGISDEATTLAIQKSLTAAMEAARQEFTALLSRHEGLIRSVWGEGSTQYIRFFPRGLSEYHQASLENIEEKMSRFEAALNALGSQLPANVTASFIAPTAETVTGGVIPRFRASRAQQLEAKAGALQEKAKAATSRQALEVQLMKNLLLVAAEVIHLSDAEKAAAQRLFPQHLLEDRAKAETPAAQ